MRSEILGQLVGTMRLAGAMGWGGGLTAVAGSPYAAMSALLGGEPPAESTNADDQTHHDRQHDRTEPAMPPITTLAAQPARRR